MKQCEQCGAPVQREALGAIACSFCGTSLSDLTTTLVAYADLCADRAKGVLRTKSKWVETSFGSTGLTGRSVAGSEPTVGVLACTESVFSNLSVEVACVLEPPRSEVQIFLRHSKEGRYALRLADDGRVAIDRLLRGPDGSQEFRFLAKAQIPNYGARWRDRQSLVVASAVGGTITLVVDGQEAVRCHDEAIDKGRFAAGMTVVPNEASEVTLTRVEIRVVERRP